MTDADFSRPNRPPPVEVWDEATLRHYLIEAGERLPPEIRERAVAQGERLVPALMQVVEDRSLAEEDAPGEGHAPLHAVDLLAELRAVQAIPALLDLVMEDEWQSLLFNRAIFALKSFGSAAYGPVLEAFRANDDPEVEPALVEVLAGLGHQDEELYGILVDFLGRNVEQGAGALAEYGDARALPLLSEVHDRLELLEDDDDPLWGDQPIIEVADAIEVLGGSLSLTQQDKLDQVRQRRRKRAGLLRAYRDASRGAAPSVQRARQLGRNDPCWCGSGKKYKKCHLETDRQAGL